MNKFNLLYCHDEGYNLQTFVSINSILKNSQSSTYDIHILHENPDTFRDYYDRLISSPKINEIFLYKFNDNDNFFPNISGKHVSAATYYRLFIENYLPKSISSLIYLDSDVIFINNPLTLLKEQINFLRNSKYVISAKTEETLSIHGKDVLGLTSRNYFNAGVMIIDIKKWNDLKISDSLYESLEKLGERIIFWDQDVLNHYFDGQYLELDEKLNYQVRMEDSNFAKSSLKSEILLHYSGKFKPWTVMGASKDEAKYFQDIYRIVFSEKYLISYNYKVNALKDFLIIIFTLKIFKIKYKTSFISIVVKSFLK